MAFQYGVSFNCYIDEAEIGGADVCCDVSYVSNNLEKLIAHTVKDNGDQFVFKTDHEYVGRESNVGGSVVGVFIEDDDYVVAVLINWPISYEIIE